MPTALRGHAETATRIHAHAKPWAWHPSKRRFTIAKRSTSRKKPADRAFHRVMPIRPQLHVRRYFLAVSAGLLAAAATCTWPHGPRWRDTSAGPGGVPSFSLDGTTLTTFHWVRPNSGESFRT